MSVLRMLLVLLALALTSCAAQRWSEGDPRQATPQPTYEVIDSVTVDLSADPAGNTLNAE